MEKRQKRAGFILFYALTCGILGAGPVIAFDFFPTCLESARVDSLYTEIWNDSDLTRNVKSLTSVDRVQYEGSTCRLKQITQKWIGGGQGVVIKYTPGQEPNQVHARPGTPGIRFRLLCGIRRDP
jgi:hypothetical protein